MRYKRWERKGWDDAMLNEDGAFSQYIARKFSSDRPRVMALVIFEETTWRKRTLRIGIDREDLGSHFGPDITGVFADFGDFHDRLGYTDTNEVMSVHDMCRWFDFHDQKAADICETIEMLKPGCLISHDRDYIWTAYKD